MFRRPPCERAQRAHVEDMRAICRYTRRRFEPTHGEVLNLHMGFSACQAAPHTPHTLRCVASFTFSQADDMMNVERDPACVSASRRRRDRRLRSFWRHEQMARTPYGDRSKAPGPCRERSTSCTTRRSSGRLLSQLGAGQHLCLRSLAGR